MCVYMLYFMKCFRANVKIQYTIALINKLVNFDIHTCILLLIMLMFLSACIHVTCAVCCSIDVNKQHFESVPKTKWLYLYFFEQIKQ